MPGHVRWDIVAQERPTSFACRHERGALRACRHVLPAQHCSRSSGRIAAHSVGPALLAALSASTLRQSRSCSNRHIRQAYTSEASGTSLGKEPSPIEQWVELSPHEDEVVVTEELLQKAMHEFGRHDSLYLFQLAAVAFPHLETSSAARLAVRRREILVDGSGDIRSDAKAPPPGSRLSTRVGTVDIFPRALEERLQRWNALRSGRPEAQMRVLFHDRDGGWAVVNKPPDMHSCPCGFNRQDLTFETYLPALLEPPRQGHHRRCPGVCHRLDFRVSGPVIVATSEQAMRVIKEAFERHQVRKEYRAIVYGCPGEVGESFTVDSPLDGAPAQTDVEVLQVVPSSRYGTLSELALRPLQGRFRQLRRHCAEALGTPIVNEERALVEAAVPAWELRHGRPMPPISSGGRKSVFFFLQAVEIGLPSPSAVVDGQFVTVRTEVAAQFSKLLQHSEASLQEFDAS